MAIGAPALVDPVSGRAGERPSLQLVAVLRGERASRGVFALVVTGALVVTMIVILVLNTSLAQGAFAISELQRQEAALAQQQQALAEAVEAEAAPRLLEARARSMGMVSISAPAFVSLPRGKVLGKAEAAAGGGGAMPVLGSPKDPVAQDRTVQDRISQDLTAYDSGTALAAGIVSAGVAGTAVAPAVDEAAIQAAAVVNPKLAASGAGAPGVAVVVAVADKISRESRFYEESLWQPATIVERPAKATDSGLVAEVVR